MNDLADQLAAVLGEEGFDDSDKLESVRTILYNRSRPATPEESKAAWADLCRSVGSDPYAPQPKPVAATAKRDCTDSTATTASEDDKLLGLIKVFVEHARKDEAIIAEIAEAVDANDKDKVFELAQNL